METEKTKKTEPEITPDVSLLARLLDEGNDENIFLFDESGGEVELEQIATVTHEGAIYAILRPLTAAEDEAVVFKIDPEDEESVNIVSDDTLAEKILEIYHTEASL
jgi:uncharacterized protein YrzB (UPF0473 family)